MGIRFYNLNGFFVKKLAHGVNKVKIEYHSGGIMKTIGKIALLAVTLFAFGATVQAQDVGQKNTTGRVIADKIIMYIPNRIVDFFDIFSLEFGSGATAKLGVRATHAFGIGAGVGPSGKVVKGFNRTYGFALDDGWQAYFLAMGKGDLTREYTIGNLPDFWYIYSGMQMPNESIFADRIKDYWALEVEAAALIDVKFGLHPLNIADFITGIFFYDLLGNDYKLIAD